MDRRLWTSLILVMALGNLPTGAAAQEDGDRAIIVHYLQDRLARLGDSACFRSLVEAQGRVDGAIARGDQAAERHDKNYDAMMNAPLGRGLVDYYGRNMRQAQRDQTKAEQDAYTFARQLPAARAETAQCFEGMRANRAEIQAILSDPAKLDQAVEQYRRTRQAVGAAVSKVKIEAETLGRTLLGGPVERPPFEQLDAQWRQLEPWMMMPMYLDRQEAVAVRALVVAVKNASTAGWQAQEAQADVTAREAQLGTAHDRWSATQDLTRAKSKAAAAAQQFEARKAELRPLLQ